MVKKKKKRSTGQMQVDVKIKILHTIADAIYSTTEGKIREAVANARDNNAKWIAIVFDQTNKTLFLIDNGKGITKSRFNEIFRSIGYGLLSDDSEEKMSYFGLGLMSIFQLGEEIEIFTRPSGQRQMLKLNVNTEAIFSKNNEKNSITSLNEFIAIGNADEHARSTASTSLLNKFISDKLDTDHLESFTEIVIKGIKEEDLNTICEDRFMLELRKLLPLKPEKGEPFLNRFTGEKSREIRKIMSGREFCETIDVFFGFQGDTEPEQLWKYFPAFRSDLDFPDDNVLVGRAPDDSFAYYFLHSVAVDLQRMKGEDVERETGFWVRNQNFLVKGADFLEKSGPGRKKKTIDKPLKPWIFGEIFCRDMNTLLTVSRNEYLFEKTNLSHP
jgi:histidine kinase/DNA gyrase B/HSP90-like ATPase